MVFEQNLEQNKPFLRALPAGRISHFTSRIYSSLIEIYWGPGKRGYITADTHCCRLKCFPVCPCAQHLWRTQILCPGQKKMFQILFRNNKCFPVCAAWKHNIHFVSPEFARPRTSWATMCPQERVLVCQGLYKSHLDAYTNAGYQNICLTVRFDFHPIGVTFLKIISTERIVFSS